MRERRAYGAVVRCLLTAALALGACPWEGSDEHAHETDAGTPGDAGGRDVRCGFDADGDCPKLLFSSVGAMRFAFDDETIYLSLLDSRLISVPKTGGPAQNLAVIERASSSVILLSGEDIYFTVPPVTRQNNAGIYRVPKQGGTPAPLVTGLASGPSLAIDGATLLYTERLSGLIRSLDLQDPNEPPESVLELQFPTRIVHSEGELFCLYNEAGTYVFSRLSLADRGLFELFREPDYGMTGPELDADFVYWFASVRGELMRAPREGGAAETVHRGTGNRVADNNQLVLHAGAAYIYDSNHTLYRVELATGAASTLVRDVDLRQLHVDASGIYLLVTLDGVYRLPL
jgi:hypothetical protein